MRLLIDGGIFNKGYDALPDALFWHDLIPRLADRLRGAEILFLNRGSAVQFQGTASIRHLYAPPVHYQTVALEFYRLAALCKEYSVTTFLSTCQTSPGKQVKSLFVDPVKGVPDIPETETAAYNHAAQMAYRFVAPEKAAEATAYNYTAQLATTRLAVYGEGRQRMVHKAGIPQDMIVCLYSAETDSASSTVIANRIAKELLSLATLEHGKIDFLSLMTQKAVANEFSRTPHAAYDTAGWKHYLDYLEYVQQQKTQTP